MATPMDLLYDEVFKFIQETEGLEDVFTALDNASRAMGAGSEYSRFSDVFWGLNRLSQIPALPMHRELQGLVFFTRPNLNLSYDNISSQRRFSHLLTEQTDTVQHAVRMMLDPQTHRMMTKAGYVSPLIDLKCPYMTLFSNACITLSPPPDIGINYYTSPEGVMKEQWIMADGIDVHRGSFDQTATFYNFKSNVMMMAAFIWISYIGSIKVGPMGPHHDSRVSGQMDYFTRIERYKLDITGRKLEQWFHTGASAPTNCSIGAGFGLNRREGVESENHEFSMTFKSVGAVYNDPIQLEEFNLRIVRWNPGMSDANRENQYVLMTPEMAAICNYQGYPRINLTTGDFEWWIDKRRYAELRKGL